MSIKIDIRDITKLKITKVNYICNKVYFEYEGQKYMLHDDSDEDRCTGLYLRDKKNPQKVTLINSAITLDGPTQFIKSKFKFWDTTLVYSQINKEYFIKKMLSHGFSTGLLEKEYKEHLNEINKINKDINIIQSKLQELKENRDKLLSDWYSTDDIFRKQYIDNIKIKAAERVNGKKTGEWCEDYKAYYGDTDPVYGGILTDLFTLPVGTRFYVENGGYSAFIGVNNHGDKVIVTDVSVVKLTKEHCSAFITIYDTKE